MRGAALRGKGNATRTQKCKQEVERPTVVGETGAKAVNEDYVKTLLLLCIGVM